jgi:hypothetical protein
MAKKATKKKAATPPKTEAVDQKARKALLKAVKENGLALEDADKIFKADREIVLAAVKQDASALKYATKSILVDREIVLAAVKRHFTALDYAAKALKADREIVLAAVKQSGSQLQLAAKALKADREIVLSAVKQYGPALEHADKSLKADREIVLAAVKQEGFAFALDYADKSLKADREIVLKAVKQNGYALDYADKSLKADREIVLAAVKQKGDQFGHRVLEYASEELQQDKELRKIAGIIKDKDEDELPQWLVTGPELTYYDWIVKKKDLNSIEKIKDYFSDVLEGGESDSTSHLVLGILESNEGNKLDRVHLSIEDEEGDAVDFSIKNKGKLVKMPKKGEVGFLYYYYYNHSSYTLQPKKKFKNICFEIKSFQGEAVLTKRDYPGFELTAEDAGGGGEFRLEVFCDDGQSFEGTVEYKEELIRQVSDYLSEQE